MCSRMGRQRLSCGVGGAAATGHPNQAQPTCALGGGVGPAQHALSGVVVGGRAEPVLPAIGRKGRQKQQRQQYRSKMHYPSKV